jgi:hypothetical protein
MKTLVIHPDDRTTDFLKTIYEGKGYTVITDRRLDLKDIIKKIKKHDRIMMLGHGCPYGLLLFTPIFMDKEFIKVLRTKDCVCIWCRANEYVEREGIRGFYTGMFISEVYEASYYGIKVSQDNVTLSNEFFSFLLRDRIDHPEVLTEMKESYTGNCEVIKFNNARLYYKKDNSIIKSEKLSVL